MLARLLAAALVLWPSILWAQWDKIDLYVSQRPATSRGDLFWTSICDPVYSPTCPLTNPSGMLPGQWNTVHVTSLGVPGHAKQIFVSGVLLISHANAGRFVPIDMSLLVNSSGYLKSNGWEVVAQGSATGIRFVQRQVNETANLKVGFKAFGDTTPIDNDSQDGIFRQWYLGHSVEVDTGQRSNFSTWIPVKDGKFEMKFECTNGHTGLPVASACGINLSVQAWGAAAD